MGFAGSRPALSFSPKPRARLRPMRKGARLGCSAQKQPNVWFIATGGHCCAELEDTIWPDRDRSVPSNAALVGPRRTIARRPTGYRNSARAARCLVCMLLWRPDRAERIRWVFGVEFDGLRFCAKGTLRTRLAHP